MISFPDFLAASAKKGHTHVLFEFGMHSLAEDLEHILEVLGQAQISFELIGGLAVLVHIIAAGEGNRSFLTKDIDVLMERVDLEALMAVAEASGYQMKRMIGGYALLLPGQNLAQATHIIFSGERPRSDYPVASPPVEPERKEMFGLTVPVAPVKDLVALKLNSARSKDKVHLEILDQCGLITPAMEDSLDSVLRARLAAIREEYEHEEQEEE